MTDERTCPYCGATARSTWEEVAHMETAHREVVAQRLADAGLLPEAERKRNEAAPPDTVWLAEMETEHFSWNAVGRTREEALAGIAAAWDAHAAQADIALMPAVEAWEYYGVSCTPVQFGAGYRDGTRVAAPQVTLSTPTKEN